MGFINNTDTRNKNTYYEKIGGKTVKVIVTTNGDPSDEALKNFSKKLSEIAENKP